MWAYLGLFVLFTLCQASAEEPASEKLSNLSTGNPTQQTVNVKVGRARREIDALRSSSRGNHGRQLVFLPFFRDYHAKAPSTFQRRTSGEFFYRPLRRHCYYARK